MLNVRRQAKQRRWQTYGVLSIVLYRIALKYIASRLHSQTKSKAFLHFTVQTTGRKAHGSLQEILMVGLQQETLFPGGLQGQHPVEKFTSCVGYCSTSKDSYCSYLSFTENGQERGGKMIFICIKNIFVWFKLSQSFSSSQCR